jgi:acyl-CoA synthetase (AMP-forming)/AMP-acid ligase II
MKFNPMTSASESPFTLPIPFKTLAESLMAAPSQKPFVTMWNSEDDVETATFGKFTGLASSMAADFQAQGLRRGDTVVLIMPQGIPLMSAFAGAMLMGAVPAILAYPNFKVEPAKYRYGLGGVTTNLKAPLVVIDEAFPEEFLGHVAVGGNARVTRAGGKVSPSVTALSPTPSGHEDLAFIQHSAGTTGLQKGVALSHAAVLRQLRHLAEAISITPEDRIYSWLPLYHDMGLIACFMLPMVYHLPVVMQSPTDWVMQPRTMLQLIAEYRCTLAWAPNFTLQFLARRVSPEDRAAHDLSSLRALINCSEPVRATSMSEFTAAFRPSGLQPHVLQSSYAMAETVFAITQSGTTAQPDPRRIWLDGETFSKKQMAVPVCQATEGAICFVSSGTCLPGSQVRVVSASGEELPPGGVGEILIRSDCLFDGYYNRPDLTEKALRDGWYCSGDLGFYLDGELYVIGRMKDLIIVAGKNIYPQDVEEIVSNHPAIHDGRVIAFGHYNPDLGTEEIIIAAEVTKEEYLGDSIGIERELKNAVVAELGVAARSVYLKPPRWIVKSTAGKPARSTTRQKLLSEHPELRYDSSQEKALGEWPSATTD